MLNLDNYNKTDIGYIILETDNLKVLKENLGYYCFEYSNELITNDPLEAAAFLLIKKINDPRIWNLRLDYNFYEYIKPSNSIYWLSGGKDFWNLYHNEWIDNHDKFTEKYNFIFNKIHRLKTMNDFKELIMYYMNLDDMYEYTLELNIN
jgi:hypothetical protein